MAYNIFKVFLVGGLQALLMSDCGADSTQCFGILGDKYPEFVKCEGSSACCRTPNSCQPNRLCRYDYPGEPNGTFYRGPCASYSGWQADTCAPICLYSGPNDPSIPQYEPRVTQCEDGTFCCDNDPTCCENDRGKILSVLDGGRITLLQPTKVSRNVMPVPSSVRADRVAVGAEILSTSISLDANRKRLELRAIPTIPSNWTWITPSTFKTSTVVVVPSLSVLSDSMTLSPTPAHMMSSWEPPSIQSLTTSHLLATPSLPPTPIPPTPPTPPLPPTAPTAPTAPTPPTPSTQAPLSSALSSSAQSSVSEKSSPSSDLEASISVKATDLIPHSSVPPPQPTTRTAPSLLLGQTTAPPVTTTKTVPTNHYSFPSTTDASSTTLSPMPMNPNPNLLNNTIPSLQPNASLSDQDQQEDNKGLITGAKAAIGILVPLFTISVAGVIFFFWRRKLKRQEEQVHFSILGERNAKRDNVVSFLSGFNFTGREGRETRNSLAREEGDKRVM